MRWIFDILPVRIWVPAAVVLALLLIGAVGFGLYDPTPGATIEYHNSAGSSSVAETREALSNIAAENTEDYRESLVGVLTVAIVAMAFTTLISVATAFYLYWWRHVLLAKPHLLVPEKWGKYLEEVGRHVAEISQSFGQGVGKLAEATSENSDRISNMIETFMTFQNALDERDAEILRLKRGYDAEVFRKFLYRFVRVNQSIDDFLREGATDPKQMQQIGQLLNDALDECCVEIFQPDVGTDYRTAEGVADNPKTLKAERPEDAFMIAEVTEVGYRLRGGEGYQIIVPAKVTIFVFEG